MNNICIYAYILQLQAQRVVYLEPFSRYDEYLLLVDYDQRNIYQLKPDSGEVRSLPMHQCHPYHLSFDQSTNGLYVICDEKFADSGGQYQDCIRKKTFDGKIDDVIYFASQGMEHCLYCCIVEIVSQYCSLKRGTRYFGIITSLPKVIWEEGRVAAACSQHA